MLRVADAKVALQRLIQIIDAQNGNKKSQWTNFERQPHLLEYADETDRKMEQISQNALDKRTITAAEGTDLVDLMLADFNVKSPQFFLHARNLQSVGYALPAALDAKCAYSDQPVVTVTDLTGFLTSGQDPTTALEYRLNILVIAVNHQRSSKKSDFVKFSESLDVRGYCVNKIDQLETVLRAVQTADQPAYWAFWGISSGPLQKTTGEHAYRTFHKTLRFSIQYFCGLARIIGVQIAPKYIR